MRTLWILAPLALSACYGEDVYDRDGDGFVDCRMYEQHHWPRYADKYGCMENLPEWELDTASGLSYSYGYQYNPLVHDCNDADPTIHPEALEEPDVADNDCNGFVDDGEGPDDVESDFDEDGFVHFDPDDPEDDCDPLDAAVHPGAEEICDDERDNDCDGLVDFGGTCGDPPEEEYQQLTGCACSGRAGRPVPYWLVVTFALAVARRRKTRSRS